MKDLSCQRCGKKLSAVALMDLKDTDAEVYCINCSRYLEKVNIIKWAQRWEKSLVSQADAENFYKVLSFVWKDGFSKSRSFESTKPLYTQEDNPFVNLEEFLEENKEF